MFIYYVYAYLRINGSPYYIGKGKKKRAFEKHKNTPTPKDKTKIVFLETNLSEIGALALERRYINWYGRKDNNTGILRNLTDGGEGISGYKRSKEYIEKMRQANIGKKRSLESIEKMRQAKLNHKFNNKKWKVTFPDNTEIIINDRILFCQDQNINYGYASKSARKNKPCKGYHFQLLT